MIFVKGKRAKAYDSAVFLVQQQRALICLSEKRAAQKIVRRFFASGVFLCKTFISADSLQMKAHMSALRLFRIQPYRFIPKAASPSAADAERAGHRHTNR